MIFLNPGWKEEWGGYLELWDIRSQKPDRSITPIFNRLVVFECSEISYHGCSRKSVPPEITRKSYLFLKLARPGESQWLHYFIRYIFP
jgi:hypothetical protein